MNLISAIRAFERTRPVAEFNEFFGCNVNSEMFCCFFEYCHDNGEIIGEVWMGNIKTWYDQNGVRVTEVIAKSRVDNREISYWHRSNLTTDGRVSVSDDNFARVQNMTNVARLLGLLKVNVNVSFGDDAHVRAFFHIINFYFYFLHFFSLLAFN